MCAGLLPVPRLILCVDLFLLHSGLELELGSDFTFLFFLISLKIPKLRWIKYSVNDNVLLLHVIMCR